MATLAQQRKDLQRKAQMYQVAMRKKLESIVRPGVGNGRFMDPAGASQSFNAASLGLPGVSNNSAAQIWRYGQSITDADVNRFIKSSGGNVYLNALKELDRKAKESRSDGRPLGRISAGVTKAAEQNSQTVLQQLAEEFQYQQDAANAANAYRYEQGLGELAFLRERNADRVQNFGKAAKADLEERFSQSLGDVTANLSGRGLGNSTIVSAFEAKNARDKARELQRLSEMVDDRAARYDTSDTANLVGFVERRNDIAPDFSALAQLAQAYGASGASGMPAEAGPQIGRASVGRGSSQQQEAIPLQFGMNLPYATSAWNAGRIADSYRGHYGNPLGQVSSVDAMGSNRYPTVRPRNTEPPMVAPREYQQTYGVNTVLNKALKRQLPFSPLRAPFRVAPISPSVAFAGPMEQMASGPFYQ